MSRDWNARARQPVNRKFSGYFHCKLEHESDKHRRYCSRNVVGKFIGVALVFCLQLRTINLHFSTRKAIGLSITFDKNASYLLIIINCYAPHLVHRIIFDLNNVVVLQCLNSYLFINELATYTVSWRKVHASLSRVMSPFRIISELYTLCPNFQQVK